MRKLRLKKVDGFVDDILGADMHAKRVASLAAATAGALRAAALGVQVIGIAMAQQRGISAKHASKQVDRLLSNKKLDLSRVFPVWIPYVMGVQKKIIVAMDWTDFDPDDHTTICLSLITTHGRTVPLVWKTHRKSELLDQRNAHEDEALTILRDAIADDVEVTIVADRGFGDTKLYEFLEELGFRYVVRFRQSILLESDGISAPAQNWVPPGGRAKMIKDVLLTSSRCPVPAVVLVHAAGMKEAWCLATNCIGQTATEVTKVYGKRFTIEEQFRDTKDIRFGMGLSATSIANPMRRDRLLLIGAVANAFLTLLGTAGENTGLDRHFRANTVKTRTHSLFRQGTMYYGAIEMMREAWAVPLLREFERLIRAEAPFAAAIWGEI